MKITTKLISLAAALILCMGLISCNQIEDTNGPDDYSLETIGDSDLTSGKGSSSSVSTVKTTVNGKTTLKIGKFSGVKEIDTFRGRGDTLEISIKVTVTEGNFRAVLVKDKEICAEIPLNEDYDLVIENADGKYSLVIAGESAKIEMVYTEK